MPTARQEGLVLRGLWRCARELYVASRFCPRAQAAGAPSTNAIPPESMDTTILSDLQREYQCGRLIVFAGIGVSLGTGLPSREELAERLRKRMVEIDAGDAALAEFDGYVRCRRFLEAFEAAQRSLNNEFRHEVFNAFDHRGRQVPPVALAITGMKEKLHAVITTNLDRFLETESGWEAFADPPGDLASLKRYILQIHGKRSRSNTWVLTREQYKRATSDTSTLRQTFVALYTAYPMLFVGFEQGFEIIEIIRDWGPRFAMDQTDQRPTHYAILPSNLGPSEKTALSKAGIRVLEYEPGEDVSMVLREMVRQGGASFVDVGVAGGTAPPGPAGQPISRESLQVSSRSRRGSAAPPPSAEALSHLVLSFLHEDRRDEVQELLGVDDESLSAIVRGREATWNREGLAELCNRTEVLAAEDVERFLSLPWDEKYLDERIRMLRKGGRGGRYLARHLEERRRHARMRLEWSGIVGQYAAQLQAGPPVAYAAMARIYQQAVLLWTPVDMDAFARSDFERDTWARIIESPQPLLEGTRWNHLHHANELIGRAVGQLLRTAAQSTVSGSSSLHRLRIIEGGVGGANTTYTVMSNIIEALGGIDSIEQVAYRGFELNGAYAHQAEEILRGRFRNKSPLGHAEPSSESPDPRSTFFKSLARKLRPLGTRGDRLVTNENMALGLREMVGQGQLNDQVDAFVCSYAFHHVPNAILLRSFLFGAPGVAGPANPDLDRLSNRKPAERERIKQDLIDCLRILVEKRSQQDPPSEDEYEYERRRVPALHREMHPLVRVILSHIVSDDMEPEGIKGILHDVRYNFPVNGDAPWKPYNCWHDRCLQDRQKELLRDVHTLLRPGGLVAIADPDGFSNYNMHKLLENAEMGVAHFRTRLEMQILLEEIGFKVVREGGRQMEVHDPSGDPKYRFTLDDVEFNMDKDLTAYKDPNLGYIVIAKKVR